MMVARCHLGCLEIIHKRPTLRTLYRYIPAVLRYACKRYEVGITKGNTDGIWVPGRWGYWGTPSLSMIPGTLCNIPELSYLSHLSYLTSLTCHNIPSLPYHIISFHIIYWYRYHTVVMGIYG